MRNELCWPFSTLNSQFLICNLQFAIGNSRRCIGNVGVIYIQFPMSAFSPSPPSLASAPNVARSKSALNRPGY